MLGYATFTLFQSMWEIVLSAQGGEVVGACAVAGIWPEELIMNKVLVLHLFIALILLHFGPLPGTVRFI